MGSRHSADEQLIERARGGDRAAQQQVWRAHRRWVAAIILAHRPRTVELEDLMQDVAVKLIAKIHTLRNCRAFRPWLRQVAVNACRGAARSAKPTLSLGVGQRGDPDASGDEAMRDPASGDDELTDQMQRRDEANRLMQQALTLPISYREPLLLRCIRGMSYKQIGDVLNLPITTIETRLARARRMLREELGQEMPSRIGENPSSTERNPKESAS